MTYLTKFFNILNRGDYLLALFGCLGLFCMFYIRFIRERLPQDIPFILSESRFYVLLFICVSLLYIIKIIIKPKIPSEYAQKLITYMGAPFTAFDNLFKTNIYALKHIKMLIKYCYPKDPWTQMFLVIFLQMIPRIILLSIFLLDVFYFHKLYYFYFLLFIGIFPWIYSYHKYSMYHAKELGTVYLEMLYTHVSISEKGWADRQNYYEFDDFGNLIELNDDDYYQDDDGQYVYLGEVRELERNECSNTMYIKKEWKPHPRNKYHEHIVTIREYLQIVLNKNIDDTINDYEDDYDFEPSALSQDYRYKHYKKMTDKTTLDEKDYEILEKEFNNIIPALSSLNLYLHYLPEKEEIFHMKKISILIYILWFIGWSYILIKSIHTLSNIDMTLSILKILTSYTEKINPFINP